MTERRTSAPGVAGIYAIACTATGKRYIGQASNIARRIAGHYATLNRGSHYSVAMQHDWNEFGREFFHHNVLCIEANPGLRHTLERGAIIYLASSWPLYNCYLAPSSAPKPLLDDGRRSVYEEKDVARWLKKVMDGKYSDTFAANR